MQIDLKVERVDVNVESGEVTRKLECIIHLLERIARKEDEILEAILAIPTPPQGASTLRLVLGHPEPK